jgi:hypothetical protein
MPQEELDANLDARYREEGWGLITDQVFNGRLRPINVESQARDVARWAYEQVRLMTERISRQDTDLIRLEKDLKESAHYAGIVARQAPMIEGLKAALALKDLELARARLETAKARADAADVTGNLAASEVVLAELKVNRDIGPNAPTRINPRSLREWLEPRDACAEKDCDHE